MEAIVMKVLTSLLILTLMTASVVTERLHIENNARALDTENKTKEDCNQDVTGVRRDARYDYDDPEQPCYTQFFVAGQPPKRLRADNNADIRYICQPPTPLPPAQQAQQASQTYYATMFDEGLGITVFSAYTLTQGRFRPQYKHPWCRTPGIWFQGSEALYRRFKQYDRGHLVPAATFSNSQEYYDSTFTYTNTVPQDSSFNRGQWSSFEKKIRKYAKTCTNPQFGQPAGKLYLLTGTSFARIQEHQNNVQSYKAQVTKLPIETIIKGNIFVPNSLWTAGCCVRQDGFFTKSFAVMGNNVPKNNWASLTRQVTVQKLQNILTKDVNDFKLNNNIGQGKVELFPGNNQCSHLFNDLGQNL